MAAIGCADPVILVTRDNDDFNIPEPEYDEEGDYIWSDGAYYMSIHQVKKPLDLGWTLRKVHILDEEEAENVNSLDEVPDSTWFTNRHAKRRLTAEELARGPGTGSPPTEPFTIVRGKELGASAGFVGKDQQGRLLFVKFDPRQNIGMGTNADVIGSKFLHAAGYNVPAYYTVTIDPNTLVLSPEAKIPGKYKVKRPMTQEDLVSLLKKAPKDSDGNIIAGASMGLPGKPKGPFKYEGVRADDPNDTVLHDNRRELRGLGLIMAWLNNTDARRGNTLDMYVEEEGRKFLRHYIIDFSGALGSEALGPKQVTDGHEYFIDPEIISLSTAAFGVWVKPWEVKDPEQFASVGLFESETFEPESWRGDYANPAFEGMTSRDAFWAATIITSFTDDEIKTIVNTGYFPDPRAGAYLARVLGQRRDTIGRYWFDVERINPLTGFSVERSADGTNRLRFVDLGVERGYADKKATLYRYRINSADFLVTREAQIPLPRILLRAKVVIETRRAPKAWGRPVSLLIDPVGGEPAVVKVSR